MAQDDRTFEVDWREHRDAVVTHLPRGGTVYVTGAKDAPFEIFARRLVDNWLGMCSERSWHYIRLRANDGQAHHRGEVLALAARALSINLPKYQRIDSSNIISGNHAGMMKIQNNTINIYPNSARDLEITQMHHLIKTVSQSPDLGLVIILPDAHRWHASQREVFYQALWVDNLATLGERVMVFALHQSGKFAYEKDTFPPSPTLTISLSNYFDPAGESGGHAIDDIANHALERRWIGSREEARGLAIGLLRGCKNMDSLYRELGSLEFESNVRGNDA